MKLFYKQNIGSFDRVVRMIIGMVGIIVGEKFKLDWLNVISVIIMLTGFFGWCGLYTLRGISTVAKKTVAKKATKKATKKKK